MALSTPPAFALISGNTNANFQYLFKFQHNGGTVTSINISIPLMYSSELDSVQTSIEQIPSDPFATAKIRFLPPSGQTITPGWYPGLSYTVTDSGGTTTSNTMDVIIFNAFKFEYDNTVTHTNRQLLPGNATSHETTNLTLSFTTISPSSPGFIITSDNDNVVLASINPTIVTRSSLPGYEATFSFNLDDPILGRTYTNEPYSVTIVNNWPTTPEDDLKISFPKGTSNIEINVTDLETSFSLVNLPTYNGGGATVEFQNIPSNVNIGVIPTITTNGIISIPATINITGLSELKYRIKGNTGTSDGPFRNIYILTYDNTITFDISDPPFTYTPVPDDNSFFVFDNPLIPLPIPTGFAIFNGNPQITINPANAAAGNGTYNIIVTNNDYYFLLTMTYTITDNSQQLSFEMVNYNLCLSVNNSINGNCTSINQSVSFEDPIALKKFLANNVSFIIQNKFEPIYSHPLINSSNQETLFFDSTGATSVSGILTSTKAFFTTGFASLSTDISNIIDDVFDVFRKVVMRLYNTSTVDSKNFQFSVNNSYFNLIIQY